MSLTDTSLLMEHPFARVPYEDYRRGFRTGQKHIERDVAEMKKLLASSSMNDDDIIDGLVDRVQGLQTKLKDLHSATLPILRARLDHLNGGEHTQTQLQRWLVDWCLRAGKDKTASVLASSTALSPLVDLSLFQTITSISISLQEHDCAPALAWARKNRISSLEFELRLQEFIELCRKGDGAIEYAQRHMRPFWDKYAKEMTQAMGLLAFPPATTNSLPTPYKRLYATTRWEKLQETFRKAVYDMYGLPHEPVLWMALYAGLVALKHCDDVERNVDCPVCDELSSDSGMDVLAAGGNPLTTLTALVPSAHHPNSVIVCRLTGKITTEPMAFPNGYVYGREALEEMAFGGRPDTTSVGLRDGFVRCPRSGYTCRFEELRKVYIS